AEVHRGPGGECDPLLLGKAGSPVRPHHAAGPVEVAHWRQEVRLVVADLLAPPAGRKGSEEVEEKSASSNVYADGVLVVRRHRAPATGDHRKTLGIATDSPVFGQSTEVNKTRARPECGGSARRGGPSRGASHLTSPPRTWPRPRPPLTPPGDQGRPTRGRRCP